MWAKLLLIFFVFSFLFKTDHSFDQDLGRHLKLGEIIWQTKSIPLTNLFSYTNPDFPFINTHWLFEVWAYVTSQALGLQSLLIFKIIIFLSAVWLTLKIIPKQNYLLLPVCFIFLHVLRERTELRPEIFSFLFTALTLFILEKHIKKLLFFLPLIQLIWINTHIYFFVGLILQGIFLASHLRCGKLKLPGIIFGLSILLSFINPNGLAGILYPLNVTKNYGYTIVENQTIFLLENIGFSDPNFLFAKISVGIAALGLVIILIKKQFDIKNISLALLGVGLALMNVRSLPYLVFLSLPATVQNLGTVRKRTFFTVLTFLTAVLLVWESFLYLNGAYYKFKDSNDMPSLKLISSSRKALDFVLKNNLAGPIYNNFDIGSYIIYRGYPKIKVYIDGRPEGYPKEFFQQTYIPSQYDYNKFKDLEKQISFKTIIFSHTDQTPWAKNFLTQVVADKDWKVIYIDDFMIVLASQGVPLEAVDLAKLNPSSFFFDSYLSYLRVALFLTQTQNFTSAQKFAEAAYSINPQSPLGNAFFGKQIKNYFFW